MTCAVIILSVLLMSVIIISLFDIVPLALRWYDRIGTGSFANTDEWLTAIKRTAKKQLIKTPVVTVSGNTRLTIIDRLNGTYKNKKIQSWQEAALLMGINSCEVETEDVTKAFIASKINDDGSWKSPVSGTDFALLGYAILSSPYGDKEKLRPAMQEIYSFLIDSVKDGTIPYNNRVSAIRFVDTVGMVCPFLYKYATEYDCVEAAELAKKQIEEYLENGMHSKLFLPVHCFDKTSGAPLGIYGWGRGCGWLAIGLAESLKCASDGDSEFLIRAAKKYADSLIRFQTSDGAWCRQTTSRDIGETSATAMIGYFMSVLYKICCEESYRKSALAARGALMSRTRKNGKIDYAQGDTLGIGFYSNRLDSMPAAQGFSLLSALSCQKM